MWHSRPRPAGHGAEVSLPCGGVRMRLQAVPTKSTGQTLPGASIWPDWGVHFGIESGAAGPLGPGPYHSPTSLPDGPAVLALGFRCPHPGPGPLRPARSWRARSSRLNGRWTHPLSESGSKPLRCAEDLCVSSASSLAKAERSRPPTKGEFLPSPKGEVASIHMVARSHARSLGEPVQYLAVYTFE